MGLERKKTLNAFNEAAQAWGSYDDFPVGPPGTDPMPHLSRNRVAQPFFLVSETDQVLIQMAGEGEIELRGDAPERMHLSPGDTVYIPACVPSRLRPLGGGENLQIRLKAEPRRREAVAWYCGCGEVVHTHDVGAHEVAQEQYWRAVQAFNGDEKLRICGSCGVTHPTVELGDIAWLDVAAALRAEG